MGAYTSQQNVSEALPDNLSPENPDWIVAHAIASQLSIPEVERLWVRFKQLGYSSESTIQSQSTENDILTDVFVRNILKLMKNDSGEVTFEAFLQAIKWFETASTKEKLIGIFQLLNNGLALTEESLTKILQEIYINNHATEVRKTTKLVLSQIAQEGSIGENEFIVWSKGMPNNQLESILSFSILPPEVHGKNTMPTNKKSDVAKKSTGPVESQVTNEMLQKVATALHRKNWQKVMIKLGFSKDDMNQFQQSKAHDKVLAMLREWRRKEGVAATVTRLNSALSGVTSKVS